MELHALPRLLRLGATTLMMASSPLRRCQNLAMLHQKACPFYGVLRLLACRRGRHILLHSTCTMMSRYVGLFEGLHTSKAFDAGQNLCMKVFPQALLVGTPSIVSAGGAGFHAPLLRSMYTVVLFFNSKLDMFCALCPLWVLVAGVLSEFEADVSRLRFSRGLLVQGYCTSCCISALVGRCFFKLRVIHIGNHNLVLVFGDSVLTWLGS